MRHLSPKKISGALALLFAGMMVTGPAYPGPPPHAGGGQKKQKQWKGQGQGQGPNGYSRPDQRGGGGGYFSDRHRTVVHDYFVRQYNAGHCPPGLAKKRNGCLPPGLARKWQIGRPLPPDVIFYDLPPHILMELGPPPPGHRFVRVASDILLITIGVGMVVDALQDLGQL